MLPLTPAERDVLLGITKLRVSRWRKLLCSMRGHRGTDPMMFSDNETDPRIVSVTLSWVCVRCATSFSRTLIVPTPASEVEHVALSYAVSSQLRLLELDLLYELNLGRWLSMRGPLRAVPAWDPLPGARPMVLPRSHPPATHTPQQ